ncbi:MAG: hypothetical protein AB8B78_06730 [Polaribacter sp.]
MKIILSTIFLIFISQVILSQKKFELKIPEIKKLKLLKNNSQNDVDLFFLYMENNYKSISNKFDIINDSDFENNPECGFKKNYEYGILFTSNSCGEASPLKQAIVFPKTKEKELRKLIENIYYADLYENSDSTNKWIKDKNEFTPEKNEAGCYYKIIQSKDKSTIEVFCGC